MQTWKETVEPYRLRRRAWVARLERADSDTEVDYFRKALFMTDVCALTVDEILRSTSKIAAHLPAHSTYPIADMEALALTVDSFDERSHGHPAGLEQVCELMRELKNKPVGANLIEDAIARSVLHWDILRAMLPFWIEMLNDLLISPDQRRFFERVEYLINSGAGQLPVAGDFLQLWKPVFEVYAQKQQGPYHPDLPFGAVGSYLDATNVYVFGVLAYCEEITRLHAGEPPATTADVKARLRRHMTRVAEHIRTIASQSNSE